MKKRLLLAATGLAAMPAPACAHTAIPGMAGFYRGLLHPFSDAAAILLLVAFSLLVQQRLPRGEAAFAGFFAGVFIGTGIGAAVTLPFGIDLTLLALALASALLVAVRLTLGWPLLLAIGALDGLAAGYVSWPDGGDINSRMTGGFGAAVGSVLVILVLASSLEFLQVSTRWEWLRIAVRVVASWVCAITIMLGALVLRGLA